MISVDIVPEVWAHCISERDEAIPFFLLQLHRSEDSTIARHAPFRGD